MEARSKPSPAIIASIVDTSDAHTDECEDEKLPSKVQSSKPLEPERRSATTATKGSPSFVKTLKYVLNSVYESPHRPNRREMSSEYFQAQDGTGKQFSKSETDQVVELKQRLNQAIKLKMLLEEQLTRTESQNQRLQNDIQRTQSEQEHRTRELEAKFQEVQSEKEEIEAEYNLFVRQQQEEKFKEIDTWLPIEGGKVRNDLDRLKREMRAFGERMSINNSSAFQQLNEADHVALLNDLAEVCEMEDNKLPDGLSSSESPALFLNALLAHHVYTTLFSNPFFFLEDDLGDILPRSGPDKLLNKIYSWTQRANQEEAHIWRSQTLRLLMPPLRGDTTTQEKDLHNRTSELISRAAKQQATRFLEGPARHLIRDEAKTDTGKKLHRIYQSAAIISYMLWTRRTTMKCYTLKNLGQLAFDPDREDIIPHSSVSVDGFEDYLKGKPISLILHPVLVVLGTDDAEDYDKASVWERAEVWLDSRKPTQ